MATTPTTKLGIPLPVAGSGEPFTVAAYNFGINALDGAAGATVVTSVSRPVSPWSGQVIFETDTGLAFIWDGSAWMPSGGGGSIEISATAPSSPGAGDLWWDSDNGKLYIYYDDGTSQQWVDAAGPSVAVQSTAPTGYEGQLWLDDTDGSMYVYYTDPGGGSSSWIGAVSRSGGILQVVSTSKTDTFGTSSTSYVDVTGLSATITPRSTSSKIMVVVSTSVSGSGGVYNFLQLLRDSTPINNGAAAGSRTPASYASFDGGTTDGENFYGAASVNISHVDSPSTTSSVTYKIQVRTSGGSVFVNRNGTDTDIANHGRTASNITLIEVAG
jgi:hypothetical protein